MRSRVIRVRLVRSVAGVFIIAIGAKGFAQELPDGPGKDVAVRICAQCHEPQRAAAVRLTREGWEATVSKMVGLGVRISDEDFTKIVDYLAENYKGEAPK